MPDPDPFQDPTFRRPDDSLGFLLWRVTHAWQRFVDERLKDHDLTHLQFALMAALGWLTRRDEATTQSDLIAFVEMHPMQVSQVLSLLESKGQISRDRHPANGRTKRIVLTTVGAETLRQAMPTIRDAHATFFGQDEDRTGDLRSILQMLASQHSP